MKCRILIKGGSGAGKTTLGQQLANRLRLPWIELDGLNHGPNWREASAEELKARVLGQLDDDQGWIVDGNYDAKLGSLILDRAETIVWLDLPLRTKLSRLSRRTVRRLWRNEDLWNGNRETWRTALWGRDSLFAWAVRSHYAQQRSWPQLLSSGKVVRLRTPGEVRDWLETFTANPGHSED